MIDPNSKFISGIVDVNPDKQGGFIPGSGHKVISPRSPSTKRVGNHHE